MPRLFAAELLRAPTRWLIPLLAAAMWLTIRLDLTWHAGWPDVSGVLAEGAAICSCITAAGTALLFARRAAPGIRSLEAAGGRTRFARSGLLLAVAGVHSLIGLALGAAYPLAVVAASDAPGRPWFSYLIFALGYLGLAVGLGAIAGMLMPFALITPPVVLLGFFLYLAAAQPPLGGHPSLVPAPHAASVLVGCAAGMLLIAAATRNWKLRARDVVRFLPAVATVGFLLVATTAGGEAAQRIREPAQGSCTADGRLCLWPEHAHHLGNLAAGLHRVDAYADTGLRITSMYEHGLTQRQGSSFDFPPEWFAYASMGMAATEPLVFCDQGAEVSEETVLASHELIVWATFVAGGRAMPDSIGGGPPGVSRSTIQQVRAWPQAKQRQWVGERVDKITDGCRG